MIRRGVLCVSLSIAALLLSSSARGDFLITGQLTGDFRPENPDNLIVDVTVNVFDATPNVASWVVSINSPLHPNVKLDEFYFNLSLPNYLVPSDVTFSNFSPTGWTPISGSNAAGSGSADFDFGVGDGTGVNNSTNLTFDLTLVSGSFTPSMFTGAHLSTGDGIPSPGTQMGAHLQSLTPGGSGQGTSGFASGNSSYTPDDNPGDIGPANSVTTPEPSSLILAALGALSCGAGALRRGRSTQPPTSASPI